MNHNGKKTTINRNFRGYHPGNYSYPKNIKQKFEICVGAILTQNTAWGNVEKALMNLKSAGLLSAMQLMELKLEKLKALIRPSGYFNQKAGYLKNFTVFFISLNGRTPNRKELLHCKGIGYETADSMLLYAYSRPEFVVDVYTRRIFSSLGIISEKEEYHAIKELFESAVIKDVKTYQEYHALIVEHAKRYYRNKPYGRRDPLVKIL